MTNTSTKAAKTKARGKLNAASVWIRAWVQLRKRLGRDDDIARALGITRQAMFKWRYVPTERVPDVARLTGIPAYQLRPDLPNIFKPKRGAHGEGQRRRTIDKTPTVAEGKKTA
jgi:hypothetical protein